MLLFCEREADACDIPFFFKPGVIRSFERKEKWLHNYVHNPPVNMHPWGFMKGPLYGLESSRLAVSTHDYNIRMRLPIY